MSMCKTNEQIELKQNFLNQGYIQDAMGYTEIGGVAILGLDR